MGFCDAFRDLEASLVFDGSVVLAVASAVDLFPNGILTFRLLLRLVTLPFDSVL